MPQVIVLATSFLEFHPEARFVILAIGGGTDPATVPNTTVFSLRDLGLDAGEEWRLPMLYTQQELSCILKPALLQALLGRGETVVIWFGASTQIFLPLSEVTAVASAGNGIVTNESIRNEFGDFGRSFVAVGSGAEPALRSWYDQLRHHQRSDDLAMDDQSQALEKMFDDVPHRVIRSPGLAIGYWNLDPETFTAREEGYDVDGRPLLSFDFRGYDPGKPHLLSTYQGFEPRILLSEYPAIAKLCDEYRDRLLRAGYDTQESRAPGPRILPSGLRLDHRMLGLYREALGKCKMGEAKEPPSPFGPHGEEGFLNWLNEPLGQTEKIVTRYMLAVRDEREDLRKAFPDPTGTDAAGFHDWYRIFGQRELALPPALLPDDARAQNAIDAAALALARPSINIAGYFRAELGIGAAARSLVAALAAAEIPFNTISFEDTANRQNHPFGDRRSEAGQADINIICVNADQIAAFAEKTGPELRHGRYTIGVWFWEVEDFPPLFHGAFNYVDEIWVASEFMRETFLKVSPKPVFKFKLPVLQPEIDPSLSRADFDLPNRFLFLFSFDFLSVLERKNPVGLIEAFKRAFQPDEDPVLLIKTINGDKRVLEMEKLRYAIRGRPDIILRDGYLSVVQNDTLTTLIDCYVSLHRSEGFGLTIAEAMALGKPAIATAYSGNLEFMIEENSFLCPCQRAQVGSGREPYPASSHWSEPDVEQAAQLLRHVYTHQEEATKRGLRGAEDIRALHSPAVAGPIIRDRLEEIRRRRRR